MQRGALLLGLLLIAAPAAAQMDSREGIALQNQILQLRQEMEQLRARGGTAPPAASSRAPASGGELLSTLLDRVNNLEEEVRRQRGRVDVLENQNRRLREDLEKFQGDMDFRLGQGGGGNAGGGNAPPARPSPPPTTSSGGAAPRTPDRALAEGQAALGRRDFAAAEAAAREALAARNAPVVAGQMLLGDALTGKRDFGNAAIAYNEAFSRARTGPRAAESLIGLANAFQGLGNRREACDTLNDLRSQFPNLSAPLAERAAAARSRAQCR